MFGILALMSPDLCNWHFSCSNCCKTIAKKNIFVVSIPLCCDSLKHIFYYFYCTRFTGGSHFCSVFLSLWTLNSIQNFSGLGCFGLSKSISLFSVPFSLQFGAQFTDLVCFCTGDLCILSCQSRINKIQFL